MSTIDNATFSYVHDAYDYSGEAVPSAGGSGCTSCGSTASLPSPLLNKWTNLTIQRFHRPRDQAHVSSLGPGVFLNVDMKIHLITRFKWYENRIDDSVDLIDPTRLQPVRFERETTAPGVYVDKLMKSTGKLTVYDGSGNPTSSFGSAATAQLVLFTGEKFTFQVVQADPLYIGIASHPGSSPLYNGRLTRFEDRNGYGQTIAYKVNSGTGATLWQIDTVTSDNGSQATFTYNPTQVGGRWVVSQISLPGGQSVTYAYSTDKLTSVQLTDGTSSTFTYTPGTLGAVGNKITFNDIAATGTHRKKTVTVSMIGDDALVDDYIINQSSGLIRALVNPNDEVVYHNRPGPGAYYEAVYNEVYYGKGRMTRVMNANVSSWGSTSFFKDGWTKTSTGGGSYSISGTPEPWLTWNGGPSGTPSTTTDARGQTISHTYDGDGWATTKTYSNNTTETYTYNTFKKVTRQKDRQGRVKKYTYDAKGNLLSEQVGLLDNGSGGETTTAETATTTHEYYPSGNVNQYMLKATIDPLGNRTDYEYDTNHRMTKMIAPADTTGGARAETLYSYDSQGRLSTVIGPGGWGTSYTYDSRSRVTKITHADNTTERFFFGTGADANLLVKQKDRAGVVTKYEYDATGRRIKTIQSYATMDLADNETLVTDPALRVEEVCTYVNGTESKETCVRAGEKTTYVYDYRHRVVETKVQPRVGTTLSTKQVYIDNKLFSSEDPYGRKTYYGYDADARMIRSIQATIPSVSYATFAAVMAATRPAATTANPTILITDYTLNNEGQTVATIDPLGISHTNLYDSRERVIEQVAASGTAVASKTKTIYDLASRVIEVQTPRYFDATDTNGVNKAKTTMTYSGRGLLLTRTDSPGTPEAATETYTYDIEGHQTTRVDARGQTWSTVWSTCCGRQQGAFDPYGHGTIVNVDGLGRAAHTATVSNVTAHSSNYKDPIDAQTLQEVTTKYDSRGRVSARTVWLTPLGLVDPANPPIYTGPPVNNSASPPTAPYGLTTTYAYDDNLTDSVGLDSTFSAIVAGLSLGADSDGSAVLVTNPAGERSLSVKDGLGRSVRSVQLDAAGAALTSNTTTYDTVVNIATYGDVVETASANALGHTNRSRTDGAGRTIQSLDATNAITAFTYDGGGRRLSVRDPNNVGQNCTYDALGRDLSCTDTASAVTSRTYNLSGDVLTQTDAKGKLTTMVYDSRGRRTSMTDRISAVTSWTYDAAGNELSMTDAENQTTVYGYDNVGRRISIQWPDHVAGQTPGQPNYGIEATAYDPAGRLLRKTNQLGDTITQVYDLAGRMLSRDYRTLANSPSGTLSSQDTFTYDAGSRMLTGVKGLYANTVTMTYDAGGRKATEALTIAGQTYTVGTTYDTAGRVNQLTYPDGTTVARTYDSRSLLSTIAYGGGTIDTRTYDTGGRLTSETLGNGQTVTRTYLTGDNLPASIANAAVGNYGYGWDANKNKINESITGAMSGYGFTVPTGGYDDQNRLTAWNRTNGTKNQSWALSAVGDWNTFTDAGVAQTRTHGPTHELLTMGAATVTHDSRGNMTQDEQAKAFTWDADNMLTQAVVPTGAATGIEGTHTYQYDILGRRVRKTVGGASPSDTVFALAGQIVVAEYAATTGSTAPLRKYINASYVDEPVLLVDLTAAGATGAATEERFYYHRNQQYSITALCDNTGTVTERYSYTAYGDPTILDGAGTTTRTSSALNNPYTYTARANDPESGLYYFRARMYEGRKGRFLSHDPIEYPDGYNTYNMYIGMRRADPSGMVAGGDGNQWYPKQPWGCDEFVAHYLLRSRSPVDLKDVGVFDKWYKTVKSEIEEKERDIVRSIGSSGSCESPEKQVDDTSSIDLYPPGGKNGGRKLKELCLKTNDPLLVIGNSQPSVKYTCKVKTTCDCCPEKPIVTVTQCTFEWNLRDVFTNPEDKGSTTEKGHDTWGAPYDINATWTSNVGLALGVGSCN